MPALSPSLALALAAFAPAPQTPLFVELDDLPGGADISYAYAISADGGVVAGESFSALSSVHGEGTRWIRSGSAWTAVGLGLPPAPPTPLNSPSLGLASDGSVVVGRVSFSDSPTIDTFAYAWSESAGYRYLPMPAASPAFVEAQAQSATEGGARIVGFGSPEVGYAHPIPLVWNGSIASGWSCEILSPGTEGMALAIDESGRSVVGWTRTPEHEASCWRMKGGTWRQSRLGALPGDRSYSQAHGLTRANGHFAVGFSGDPSVLARPVRWRIPDGSAHAIEAIDVLPGFSGGTANAVSKGGKRIVGSCYGEISGEFVSDSFVWDDGLGSRSLKEELIAAGATEVVGWALTSATGISEDGTVICGYGTNPDGIERAWVATIP